MNVITWLQLVTIAIPFISMIAISAVLIAEERHEERSSHHPLRTGDGLAFDHQDD